MPDPNGPKRLNVAMPRDLHKRLLAVADERLVSPSLIVEKAVARFLDGLAPVGKMFEEGDG